MDSFISGVLYVQISQLKATFELSFDKLFKSSLSIKLKLIWIITSVAPVIITLQILERNIITLQTVERNGSYITNFILLLRHDVIINHPHIQLGDGLIELTRMLHRVTIQLKERLQARYLLF